MIFNNNNGIYSQFIKINNEENNNFIFKNEELKKKFNNKINNKRQKILNQYKKNNHSKCNNKSTVSYIINDNKDNCDLIYNDRIFPKITHHKDINQLFPRSVLTTPNTSKGNINQEVEIIIKSGEDTSQKKSSRSENVNSVMPLNKKIENQIFNKNLKNDISRTNISSRKLNKKQIKKCLNVKY